jgi:hypothetical protein
VDRWLRGRANCRVLNLDYGEVLANPSGAASRLVEFLKRPLDSAGIAAAVNPSLQRQKASIVVS